MEPGSLFIVYVAAACVFAILTRRNRLFLALSFGSLLSSFFYGWVWWEKRQAYLKFHEQYGDLGIYPASRQPRGWHSIILDFQSEAMTLIWGLSAMVFVALLFFRSGKT